MAFQEMNNNKTLEKFQYLTHKQHFLNQFEQKFTLTLTTKDIGNNIFQ
ncbi:10439_t:CDS:1, partial [Cetraspora pellucida]